MASQHFARRIKKHLKEGEDIWWCQDAPRLNLGAPAIIPLMFLMLWTLVLAGFALFFLFEMSRDAVYEQGQVMVALAMLAASALSAAWFWRTLKARERIVYAITNQAALVIEDIFPRGVMRFGPEKIAKRRRVGDCIAFDTYQTGEDFSASSSFQNVKDMKEVEALLDKVVEENK